MTLKKMLLYTFFIINLSIWLTSLLAIYFPLSNWVTPTFPLQPINPHLKEIFFTSTALSALTSLLLGLKMLRPQEQKAKPTAVNDKPLPSIRLNTVRRTRGKNPKTPHDA